MSKKQLLIFLSVIILAFLAIQPFNYLCRLTNSCDPIILSYYLPKKTGKFNFDVIFEARDYSKDLNIFTQQRSTVLLTGKNYEVKYLVKNASDKEISFRPMRYVSPKAALQYLEFYECLCFREYSLKPGGSKLLSVKFRINPDIEKDKEFKNLKMIRLGYELTE